MTLDNVIQRSPKAPKSDGKGGGRVKRPRQNKSVWKGGVQAGISLQAALLRKRKLLHVPDDAGTDGLTYATRKLTELARTRDIWGEHEKALGCSV